MQLPADRYDAHLDYLTRCGAYAATMAACAFMVLHDDQPLPDGVTADLVLADYWYHIGRRTAAAADLCHLLACDFPTALAMIAAHGACDDDPADRHLPADGIEHLSADFA